MSDGSKISTYEDLYDCCMDQGHTLNIDQVIGDDESIETSENDEDEPNPNQYNEKYFNFEVHDLYSDHSVIIV